jgi:hypothetical protein
MKRLLLALLLASSSSSANTGSYTAVYSCLMGGTPITPETCLLDSTMKITKGNTSKVYTVDNFFELHMQMDQPVHNKTRINLGNGPFEINTRNNTEGVILNIKVYDPNGKLVFSDEAAQYGRVSAGK